jgi:hypothetical protein
MDDVGMASWSPPFRLFHYVVWLHITVHTYIHTTTYYLLRIDVNVCAKICIRPRVVFRGSSDGTVL